LMAGSTYAALVAVEQYQQSNIPGVQFAVADAEAMQEMLIQQMQVPAQNIKLWTNEQATRSTFEHDLKYELETLGPEDQFIFFYAGHGFYANGSNRLSTWETRSVNVGATTVCLDEVLLSRLKNGPCRKSLVFIDACASTFSAPGTRSLLHDMRREEFDAFVQSTEYCGAFFSCSPAQQSYSSETVQHGIWTYHVLKAFRGEDVAAFERDRLITGHSLQNYLTLRVPEFIAKKTEIRDSQRPYAVLAANGAFEVLNVPETSVTDESEQPDVKLPVPVSFTGIRESLDTRAPVAAGRKTESSRAPKEIVAVPPYLAGTIFQGRKNELQTLSDWARGCEPVLVLEAIGGMGKSFLSWHWAKQHAHIARQDLAGIFWYSFYERGADMRDFCAYAVSYLSGDPVEELRELKMGALVDKLLPRLQRDPWLLILDGLERVLVAYNRYDASHMHDGEADAFEAAEDGAKKRPADFCIRPSDSDLLQALAGAGPSKFLLSSRLMPRALLNRLGTARPGVAHVKLSGLDPSDAETVLRAANITGDSAAIRHYLARNFGCHPLVVGAVGGLVRNYAPAPGDFDRWAVDPLAGAALSLAELDVVQKRNHVLKIAFDDLTEDARTLMARIGLVGESVDYPTLVELNPRRPDPPAPPVIRARAMWAHETTDFATMVDLGPRSPGAQPHGLRFVADAKQAKNATDQYQKDLQAWITSPALQEAEIWLRATLQDLELRGVLQWDRKGTKFNLHPVVGAYAVSLVPPEHREGVAQRLVNYFNSIPHPPWDDARTLSDLKNGLYVARANLHLGRFKAAAHTLLDLGPALINLEAYEEFLTLLYPIFSEGWDRPTPQVEGTELNRLQNHLAICLAFSGHRNESMDITEALMLLDIDRDRHSAVLSHLRTLSVHLNELGRFYDDSRVLTLIEAASTVVGTERDLALANLWSMHSAMQRGEFETAERLALKFATSPHPASRTTHRTGEQEYWSTWLSFYTGRLDEAMLVNAEQVAVRGNNRTRIRDFHSLRGEWHLSLGQWTAAATAFEEGIRMAREVNLSAADSEARLAFAQAKLGRIQFASEEAERLSELDVPPSPSLAELYLALGDLDRVRQQVLPAYRTAWADGEPYVNWWALQRCRKVLQVLGDPEPELPKFAASTLEPMPYEANVLDYIKRKKEASAGGPQ
jgi:uncharacterized caspase-like protein/tetratricopeptide (TPR) repeat protein